MNINSFYECYNEDEIQIGYYLDEDNDIFKLCDEKCRTCSYSSKQNNLCISCNTAGNYYPKFSDSLDTSQFYECYHKDNEQIGYYVDNDNNIFKPVIVNVKLVILEVMILITIVLNVKKILTVF